MLIYQRVSTHQYGISQPAMFATIALQDSPSPLVHFSRYLTSKLGTWPTKNTSVWNHQQMQHPKKESNEGKKWERQNQTIIALKNVLFLFLIVSLIQMYTEELLQLVHRHGHFQLTGINLETWMPQCAGWVVRKMMGWFICRSWDWKWTTCICENKWKHQPALGMTLYVPFNPALQMLFLFEHSWKALARTCMDLNICKVWIETRIKISEVAPGTVLTWFLAGRIWRESKNTWNTHTHTSAGFPCGGSAYEVEAKLETREKKTRELHIP